MASLTRWGGGLTRWGVCLCSCPHPFQVQLVLVCAVFALSLPQHPHCPPPQVLEPKDGNQLRNWDERDTGIGELLLMGDDDQPLPQNVSFVCVWGGGCIWVVHWGWGFHCCKI